MKAFIYIITIFSYISMPAQSDATLDQIIQTKDSLLFSVGFNTCNLAPFYELVSEDCEFYHDQSGFTDSKNAFINQIENGLCKLDYKATRELISGTTSVFPMKKNGELYGAIQHGKHRFYATYPDKEPQVTSEARFTHLWILDNNNWHLKRVLSYDHKVPVDESNK